MAKYKWDNLIVFVEQLAAAGKLGLPLDETLRSMSREAIDPGWRRAQEEAAERVSKGGTLAEALNGRPEYFPAMVRRLIELGEKAGALNRLLPSIGEHLQSSQEVRTRMQRCLIYPFFVWTILVLEMGILYAYVLPKLMEMFESMDAPLPALTREFAGFGAPFFVIVAAILFYFAWLVIGALSAGVETKPRMAERVDSIMGWIPLLGALARHAKAALACEVMGILMESGHSGREAANLTRQASIGPSMKHALGEIERAIEGGETAQHGKTLIPATTLWMISESRDPEAMGRSLRALGNSHRRQLDALSGIVREIVEPLLFIVVALLAGVAIVSFYYPIFNMTQNIM